MVLDRKRGTGACDTGGLGFLTAVPGIIGQHPVTPEPVTAASRPREMPRPMPFPPKTAARRLVAAALAALACLFGGPQAHADWRPAPGQRFDLQLTPPLNLVRRVDVLGLELFRTTPEAVRQLQERGVAAVCHVAAGYWESWRPDAFAFPQALLGRNRPGRSGERWLDIRHPDLRPVLEKRLDLCRERGFKGVLLAGLDGQAHASGFPLQPGQQTAFNGWLAAAAHQRGLAAGIMVNGTEPGEELAALFDFLVADGCLAVGDCSLARPFLRAGKPVHLIGYTNVDQRMDRYCALAADIGAPVIFKTQYLNGKLHRRCP
jgi:hypothetical protein